MSDQNAPVVVTAPARADVVHVLRAVVASVAARLELPFDAVEEVRIAVDEASTLLLRRSGSTLELTILPDHDGLTVWLATDGASDGWPPSGVRETWPWRVITGLTQDARFDVTSLGPAIRFARRRAPNDR